MKTFRLLFSSALVVALLPQLAPAQTVPDSIAAWTERLRSGTLSDKLYAAEGLAAEDPQGLPLTTEEVIVSEFVRINDLMRHDLPIPGIEELVGEDLGELYFALASMVYAFDSPAANRALISSAGGSRGMQQKIAEMGDEAIDLLVERIEDEFAEGDAIESLALAWFWADSTGAYLSDASRSTIVKQIAVATRSDNYSLRFGAAEALRLTGDPAFLPLAREFEERATATNEVFIDQNLRRETVPVLEEAAAALSIADLADRSHRVIRFICAGVDRGAKRGACQSLQNEFDAALRHLKAGRTGPARNGLKSVVRRADQALTTGALTEEEYALVAGGARQVLGRL